MSVLETIRGQLDVARRVVDVLEHAVEEIEAAQQGNTAAPGKRVARRPQGDRPGTVVDRARRSAEAADAQPVADEAGGPPPSRRTAKKPVAKPRVAKPAVVEGEKYCRACDTSKPVAEFNKNATARDGLQSQCRPCQRQTIASSAAKTPSAPPPASDGKWVDPAARLKLIRERAAGGAS